MSLGVAPNATAGVPANATAVVMNVTVTNTTAASFLTVYPTGGSVPFASNLNWVAGYTVPNLVVVQPGSGGSVTFFNKFGSTDVLADVAGYFAPPSGSAGGEVGTGFPQRLVDTRAASGHLGAGTSLGAGATQTYQVTGNAGVPASGVSAVIVNATVTNTTAASFLTLWAAGATQNTVSNANWVAGWTRANRAIVPVSATGQINAFNKFGTTDLILDVDGYFTDATASGKLFTSVSPIRLTDHQPLGPNSTFNLSVGGVAGVPATASAAILDAVASETTAPSFLTAFPAGGSNPGTSDINWVAGQVNPNLTVTTLGTSGQATFFNSAGNVNVSVDLEGFFGGAAGVAITANPSSVPADGTVAASKINTTVTDSSGNPIALDPVNFTLTGTPAGACGSLQFNSQTTNGAGQTPTNNYNASITSGTCKITATEALHAQTGSVTITQTPPQNRVTFTPASSSVAANGSSTPAITVNVFNPITGNQAGDLVSFTTAASTAGSCGTIGSVSGTPAGTTDAGGNVTFVYTASSTIGFCTVTATESATSASGSSLITQESPSAPANTTVITDNTSPAGHIPADGKSTATITTTVSGPASANDALNWALTAGTAGSCGALSAVQTTTNTSGVATATYTASTTPGTCTIKVTEANGGSSNTDTITQDTVPNHITATANPAAIPANGTSTSAITVTVTNGVTGAPVVGETLSFITFGNDPLCSIPSGAFNPTNASGQVVATYTSNTSVGFCTLTFGDASGGTGSVRIVQTNPASAALVTTVTASPASIAADGAATSTITATVKTSGGTLISGDHVAWTLTPSTAGACPATPPSQNTGLNGQASFTYTATTTVGSCSITATEANSASSGSATVTQTAVPNTVTVTLTANNIPVGTTTTVTVHVTHVGTAVKQDAITFALAGNPSTSCGSVTGASNGGLTDNTGTLTATYGSSAFPGFCTITATEAAGGQSGSATIDQTTAPKATNTVVVTDNKGGTLVADGSSTATITATIGGTSTPNDEVMFTLTPSVAGACGTITPTFGNTGTGTTVTATYKASTTAGTCHITATEANGNTTSVNHDIVQTPRPFAISLTANPQTVSTSASGTSTLTVTVTDQNTGLPHSGDHITFVLAPQNGAGSCGAQSNETPATGNTDSNGMVTETYTSGATIGSCMITATETDTGQSATTTITQTA